MLLTNKFFLLEKNDILNNTLKDKDVYIKHRIAKFRFRKMLTFKPILIKHLTSANKLFNSIIKILL